LDLMSPEHKILYCRAVAQMLIVDTVLTDLESAFLQHLMERLQMTDEEKAQVLHHADLSGALDGELRQLPLTHRRRLMEELKAAATVDGSFSIREGALLQSARALLALDAAEAG
jgi:hypothetical protein